MSAAASRPSVTLIVARARNGVIGRDGALPWRLPEDLSFFRRTTIGHVVVMGRRTWDSIGRPLPQRRNIVVTRQEDWHAPGCEVTSSLEQALAITHDVDEVFVIGGAALYRLALPLARRLIVTEIDADFDGDTHFPPIDATLWRETAREHLAATGDRHFGVDWVTYEAAGPRADASH